MAVIFDTREPRTKIEGILARIERDTKLPEINWKKLDWGDYRLENGSKSALIERKEIHDYTATFGKLKDRQLHMKELSDFQYLMIEGKYIYVEGALCLYRGKKLFPCMSWSTHVRLLSRLNSLGLNILWVNNIEETLRYVLELHEFLPQMELSASTVKYTPAQILTMFPGVGVGTAAKVRAKYLTPLEAYRHIEEWIPKKSRTEMDTW